MSSISSIARSGMSAASLGLQVAAHNLANVGTEGFTRQQVVRSTQAAGGVGATVRNAPQPGADLERDLVAQMSLGYEFKAHVLSLRAEDDRIGTLLDLRA